MTSKGANSIRHIKMDTWNLLFQVWAIQNLSVLSMSSQTESTYFIHSLEMPSHKMLILPTGLKYRLRRTQLQGWHDLDLSRFLLTSAQEAWSRLYAGAHAKQKRQPSCFAWDGFYIREELTWRIATNFLLKMKVSVSLSPLSIFLIVLSVPQLIVLGWEKNCSTSKLN